MNEFLNYFSLFAVDLDNICSGPLDTSYPDDGLSSSAIDLIVVPRLLLQYINWAYVFEKDCENLSDCFPIVLSIKMAMLQHCDTQWFNFKSHQEMNFLIQAWPQTKFIVYIHYLWLRS